MNGSVKIASIFLYDVFSYSESCFSRPILWVGEKHGFSSDFFEIGGNDGKKDRRSFFPRIRENEGLLNMLRRPVANVQILRIWTFVSFIQTARHANLMNGFAGACLRRIRESRDRRAFTKFYLVKALRSTIGARRDPPSPPIPKIFLPSHVWLDKKTRGPDRRSGPPGGFFPEPSMAKPNVQILWICLFPFGELDKSVIAQKIACDFLNDLRIWTFDFSPRNYMLRRPSFFFPTHKWGSCFPRPIYGEDFFPEP